MVKATKKVTERTIKIVADRLLVVDNPGKVGYNTKQLRKRNSYLLQLTSIKCIL